jgi:hypothetical protein
MCYVARHEPHPAQLERSAARASLAAPAERLAAASDRRGVGGQRCRRQPRAETGSTRRLAGPPLSPTARCTPSMGAGPAGASARSAASWPRVRRLPRPGVDPDARGRGDPCRVWRGVSPHPCGPAPQRPPLEPSEAQATGPPARRSGDHPLAHRDGARDQTGAAAPQQTILFRDEAGFDPLPSVVRT